MIQSMTGFGAALFEDERMVISVEVKSLNSKFSDVYVKIPRTFSNREIEIRNLLSASLERGKIEMNLNIVPKVEDIAGTTVNRSLVKAYYRDLFETATEIGFAPEATDLLRMATMMPNVYNTNLQEPTAVAQEWEAIVSVIKEAVEKCQTFRKIEGEKTKEKFLEYLQSIESLLIEVDAQDPKRIPVIRERLEKAVAEYVGVDSFDHNRLEQELIYYIEKFDLSEEKVRLKNHIDYLRNELNQPTNGKKLNFISQEIGREINTIGSKANDAVIQRLVVQMKDELEKIKEQTANIL